ncbi:MAG: M23 family metallopeptidase [Candidatus Andersenbacteria bacterium]
MSYPAPSRLNLPITPYTVSGYAFGERLRRHIILWATHLGDDIVAPPGTPVTAIGEGEVVWSEMRVGTSEKRNWGGIIIVGHTHHATQQPFFSVYGHLHELQVKVGEPVTAGQLLGKIAPGSSPENGWWKKPHLHCGIYVGPWRGDILPGYKRPEEWRTRVSWWRDPQPFIREYGA